MATKSLTDLQTLLWAEKMDALAAVRASKLSSERTHAMDYYNGDVSRDMPAQEGRSRAVSTDVSDTIEGLMPSLMEIFAGSDDVIRFDPHGPEDVKAAEQETDYVNHVFMQENPGFLILYSFIKDSLLSKIGIVKVFWEETDEEHRETYLDIPDDSYALLASDPDIEIVEHTEHPAPPMILPAPQPGMPPAAAQQPPTPPMASGGATAPAAGPSNVPPATLHDCTVMTKRKVERACVMAVPPEEFGISRFARSLRDCGYCFHEVIRRHEDLVADGYDEDQIKAMPTYTMLTNPEELARDTVDEHLAAGGDEGINEANRQIKITEHYVRMDYHMNGKPALYMVTTGGDQGQILRKKTIGENDRETMREQIEEVDHIPFACMTPVIVTHRFFGRSIADLVMDIQRIKTALFRSILDNAYLAVNARCVVSEVDSTDTTLDDLLVSRPGGIVRVKQNAQSAVQWQTVPAIAGEIFPVLEYVDSVREWRTGVNKSQQGLDAQALQNQSATAAMQVYNASQAKMKLIARIFAETGIKDLFWLLHAIIRKNGSQQKTVQLRKQWVTVNPREWKERDSMTINVGLGSGGAAEQIQKIMAIGNVQKDLLAGGFSNIVQPRNLYHSAIELAKLTGRKDGDDFFTDPATVPAPQSPPDPKMAQIQGQLQLAQAKQQADTAHEGAKAQSDMAIQQQKFELEMRQMLAQHSMDTQKHQQEIMQTHQKHQVDMASAVAKLHLAAQSIHAANAKQNGATQQ